MTTISEDYVSFETAKLLKEKGFDVYGDGSFNSGIEVFAEYSPSGIFNKCSTSKPHQKAYSAPTLQMAMKWLRIEHNIHIEPHLVRTKCSYGYMPNYININDLTQHFPFKEIDFCDLEKYVCMTYDKACETTIRYCIENLI